MESVLFRMQGTAQQYVEILREILGIDVSILDAQQIRVAGSGRMKERTGSMVHYGNIMRRALETRQTVVVTDPISNPLCEGCPSRSHCDNLCEMWAPILVEDTPIGVIGCVCYNTAQQDLFIQQQAVFEQFFGQFAELLSSQAKVIAAADRSQNIQEMLEQVLGLAQIGMLILNQQGNICRINQTGKEILGLEGKQPDYSSLSVRPSETGRSKEFIVYLGNKEHKIVADIYHIGMESYDRMVLFGDAALRTEASDGLLRLAPLSDLDRISGELCRSAREFVGE